MVSAKGQAIRFHETDARPMGRDTSGVAGMKLRKGDEVISINIAEDDADLLVVTENGYGKRTRVSEYPVKGRGGMGVKTVQLTEARGHLVGSRVVRDGYQVMLISTGGVVIKMPVTEVKRLGRSTQGVIVMRLRDGEQVSSLAPVVESGDDDDAPAEPAVPPGQTGTFDTLDANKDGRISMPEASADPKLVESFSTADKNGDGYLDNAEFDNVAVKPRR
jgi:DNA gyrase subunit A